MPGDARRAVAHDLLAHARPEAVRADQHAARHALAGEETRRDVGAVLLVAGDGAPRAQLDQRVVLARAQEDAVQVAAVHDGVGVAEALAELAPEVDGADVLGGHGVHEAELVHIHGHVPGGIADAEVVEGVEGVGAELDAGADLAEHRRALEHDDREPFLGEAEGCRQAADPAASDEDGLVLLHGVSPDVGALCARRAVSPGPPLSAAARP